MLRACPSLGSIRDYLGTPHHALTYAKKARIEAVHSSFKTNGYGSFFYAFVRALKPKTCLELGVYQGFSMLSVAAALRDNGEGMIEGVDLFEDYPYRHAKFADVKRHIHACDLGDWTKITKEDATAAHKGFGDLDYLHVDLSNDGETFQFVFEKWAPKVRRAIILEGGADERDRVDWMVKYRKAPISPVIDEIRNSCPDWNICVLAPFPSVTVAMRSCM